ncbi:hypothetical protein PRIPAC_80319 [Pristionchus pacificus]|nr:hypothetical protein PRIPAC_80319 [Pristionchus pacificus]
MPCEIGELPKKEMPMIVEHTETKIEMDEDAHDEDEIASKASSDHSGPEDDYKIDKLFYRICYFCFILGVNFYRKRCPKMRCLSMIVVLLICSINLYFIGYVAYLSLSQKFDADRIATSISMGTWVLQATLSTLFLAWWQYTSQPCKLLKMLYESHKGVGIHHHRKSLVAIVNGFYLVLGFVILYYVGLIIANLLNYNVGYMDDQIPRIFGDRRLFVIVQLANLYCILCWGVALFIFSLLIHSTHYEFVYYNDQVRSLIPRDKRRTILKAVGGCDGSVEQECIFSEDDEIKCNQEYQTDEALCNYLLKLIKIHNRLTEVVKRLDKMFHRYAFLMIATIIPTTIFSLFMVVHNPHFCIKLLFSCPLVFFCVFSFFALVNAPSQLHDTIYNTKSALCANTHIWFPYRPNVYHSALAFVCHLDQTNLGVSIWGFAVVSKPLVLTTLSVMVTCLALFLQVGECNSISHTFYFPPHS